MRKNSILKILYIDILRYWYRSNYEPYEFKSKNQEYSKEKNISAQVILQNYFFERFLDRLSRSEYQENFIIKGGLLIAIMAGLDTRSTMDVEELTRR